MRGISFAITTDQVKARTKTVTRRLGWWNLQPGNQLKACEKCMGLKKGEKVVVLAIIEVVSVRKEPLRLMADQLEYGIEECRLEGFPDMTPDEFIAMFCRSHTGCTPESDVNRIEYRYLL